MSKRIPIIMEWIERGAERYARVQEKIGMMAKNMGVTAEGVGRFGKRLASLGRTISWMSFRLVIAGRIVIRYMMEPLKRTIDMLTNWEKTLEEVAISLALLEAQGMLTAGMQDFLYETMAKIPTVGLQFQAAMGALTSVLAGIALDVGPILSDLLLSLAEVLREVWTEIRPTLIPALNDLATSVLPPLIAIVREFLPPFASGFIDGVRTALPLLISLVNALKPFAGIIGKVVGFLIPFAPLLVAVGMALYFLSPILTIVGASLSVLSGVAGVVSAAISHLTAIFAIGGTVVGGFTITLSTLLPIIGIVVAAVAAAILIWQHWGEIVAWFNRTFAPLKPLFDAVWKLLQSIWNVIYQVGRIFYELGRIIGGLIYVFLKFTGILDAINKVVEFFKWLWDSITGAINKYVIPIINTLSAVLKPLTDLLGGVADALGGVADWLWSLCFRHAAGWAREFGDSLRSTAPMIEKTAKLTKELGDELREPMESKIGVTGEAGMGAAGAGVAGAAAQTIYVTSSVTIEKVEGVADLDMVTEAVNKGISESFRRRLM